MYGASDVTGQVENLQRKEAIIDDFPKLAGETDDSFRIQRLIDYVKVNGYRKAVLTDGTYEVSRTIYLAKAGEKLGVVLEGVSPETVQINVTVTGSTPVFAFEKLANNVEGWNEPWSNAGLKNLRIRAKNNNFTGTAIYVRGGCFNHCENIRITNMKYGIHLHNEGADTYSEVNCFRDFRIDFCENAIRMEKGSGNDSFHGNVFDKVYMNVKPNQTGFNHVSGYYYNGRFDLFMWAQHKGKDGSGNPILPTGSERPVLVNANGKAKNNIGNITVEAYGEPVLAGTGFFWFEGFIKGIGGTNQPNVFADTTVPRNDGTTVFRYDNNFNRVERKSLTANAGVTQTTTFTGYKNADAPYIASIRVYGAGFEYRRLMWCWYTGATYNLVAGNEIAAFPETTKTGVTITSRWVDTNGNFGINIQTDIPLTLEYKAFAFNMMPNNAIASMQVN